MSSDAALEALLDELEFQFADDNVCGLYFFSWALADFRDQMSDQEIEQVCREGYDEINRRHPLKLVWVDWPIKLEEARDAEPGTPLDFEISADGEVKAPMLALVRLD